MQKMLAIAVISILGFISSSVHAQTVIEGEIGGTASFPSDFVNVENLTVASVLWNREDDVLVSKAVDDITYTEPRALLDADDYSLRLSDLKFSDAAEYSVTIISNGGVHRASKQLKVLASPEVSTRVISVLDDGTGTEQLVAECMAKGGSDPFTIEWYDGNSLVVNATEAVDNPNAEFDFLIDSTLQLSLVANAAMDNGRTLNCVVIDAFGRRIEEPATLEVSEPTTTVETTTMQAYPKIDKFPNQDSITLVMEKKRTMTCRATGVPEPTITWYKDNIKVKSELGESKLEVLADDYSKTGTYKCEAQNIEGKVFKEVAIDVQGPPGIQGLESLVNETESYQLNTGDEYVQLKCQSDAYPIPDITWSVSGFELSDLDTDSGSKTVEGTAISYFNISAGHFIGDNRAYEVVCTASNNHGVTSKKFAVYVPVAVSNTGLIVGVVIAVLLLVVLLVFLAVYCLLLRNKQGTLTANPEERGVCGLSTCCGESKVKSTELQEEDDGVTVEHVKEVGEEGTQEEKQKLTQAEEGQNKEDETNEENEGEGETKEEQKPKKSKRKISLPMQCCKGRKKTITNEDSVEKDEDEETGNGDTKAGNETEKDSGKGDTLEKVVEDDTQK